MTRGQASEANGQKVARRLYRSSPRLALCEPDALDPSWRRALAGSLPDSGVGGLLIPAGDVEAGTIKVVNATMARLFEQLREPTWLPSPRLPEISDEDIGDLVGAELLEVEIGGRFVTGLEALGGVDHSSLQPPAGALGVLSHKAIVYGESLGLEDQADLADRLYNFNRIAIRSSWRDPAFGDAFRNEITLAMPQALAGDTRWVKAQDRPWRGYRRADLVPSRDRETPKLYVSPGQGSLPEVVAASIPVVMGHSEVIGWKVANDVETMVRPDKFVVYLKSHEALKQLADDLAPALRGVSVHGVPFTCDVGLDGLLSCGTDPPLPPDQPTSFIDSWRTWVAARVAGGLVQARRAGLTGMDAHAAALSRARAAGIDTTSWQKLRTSGPIEA